MEARKGEKDGLCRSDWGQIIIDCMKFCLQTKYDQCEKFRKTLAETTGFSIVEDQTSKRGKADTWGVIRKEDKFVGSNLMGRLLIHPNRPHHHLQIWRVRVGDKECSR